MKIVKNNSLEESAEEFPVATQDFLVSNSPMYKLHSVHSEIVKERENKVYSFIDKDCFLNPVKTVQESLKARYGNYLDSE